MVPPYIPPALRGVRIGQGRIVPCLTNASSGAASSLRQQLPQPQAEPQKGQAPCGKHPGQRLLCAVRFAGKRFRRGRLLRALGGLRLRSPGYLLLRLCYGLFFLLPEGVLLRFGRGLLHQGRTQLGRGAHPAALLIDVPACAISCSPVLTPHSRKPEGRLTAG